MKTFSILVIGSIMMDLCLRTERIPLAGESMICDDYYRYIHGGKGANQAIAAARLCANTAFSGKVGSDPFGIDLAKALREAGICTDYLMTEKEGATGLAAIILEKNGQNRIIVYPESNMKLTPAEVEKAFEKEYDAMMIQFEIPRETVIHACRTAKEKGIPFIVDAGPAQNFPIEEITGAQILSPNETETYAMCRIRAEDSQSAEKASEILMRRSKAKYIVIKAGGNGAYLYDGANIKHFPAYQGIAPVDTTAAGDAFTAAMTLEYLKTNNIEEAIRFAHAAGAISVTRMGAQPSLPALREVEDFIAANR
ncbi:MAG: ribokinase [Oscillospiraceae bacterium]|nr:ribokinase [Oscillospiraceae bacterium]